MDNQEKNTQNNRNYELNSEAVESLANADREEIPQYSEEELSKYRKKKFQIPEWLKVLFVKFWFAGAICYFIIWGLPGIGWLDQLVILAMVYGMVTDLLTNNVIRFMEAYKGANDKWMLVTRKGVVGFGLNLFMAAILTLLVYWSYAIINLIVPVGVEPLLFGLLCMGVDLLLIGIKRLILSIVNDAKDAAKGESTRACEE